jgi:hypothetical protein
MPEQPAQQLAAGLQQVLRLKRIAQRRCPVPLQSGSLPDLTRMFSQRHRSGRPAACCWL